MAEFVAECQRLSVPLAGCLLDARAVGTFGGTGQVAPWELIAKDYDKENWPPLILAGGLNPDNVAEAIQIVRPFGVDTASGVESSSRAAVAACARGADGDANFTSTSPGE